MACMSYVGRVAAQTEVSKELRIGFYVTIHVRLCNMCACVCVCVPRSFLYGCYSSLRYVRIFLQFILLLFHIHSILTL